MSADDLLYAPIDVSAASMPDNADFLVRPNSDGFGYDWKPLSDRAKTWAKVNFPMSWLSAFDLNVCLPNNIGWLKAFCKEPNGNDLLFVFGFEELRREHYIFEMEK